MFGDNNQGQQTNDNTTNNSNDSSAVSSQDDPNNNSSNLSSFTMDQPKDLGPALPPTRAASISPPPPPPPLPDINSVDESEALKKAVSRPPVATDVSSGDAELMSIKQQALNQLQPMVSHLDQTPEEKFKTLMMMIQASDNKDLIKQAFDAAEQITDEKTKAQALLDIVNEINYFTRKDED